MYQKKSRRNCKWVSKPVPYRGVPYTNFVSFRFSHHFSTSDALCFLDQYIIVVSMKINYVSIYHPSRRLNIRSIKSKYVLLRFIALSYLTSTSYLYQLRAILYYWKNTSLFAISMHVLLISNVFIFLRWR